MNLFITVNGKADHKRMVLYAFQNRLQRFVAHAVPKINEFFETQAGYSKQ